MPELPEIETVRLQLQKHLVGEEIARLEKLHAKSVQGNLRLVEGKKITAIERKGKMLVIDLEKDICLAIHFKMSGQLILVTQPSHKASAGNESVKRKAGSRKDEIKNRIVGGHPSEDWLGKLPSKHTRAVFHLKSGDTMYFNDQRIFGWVKILSKKELEELPFVKDLGPEPWDLSDSQFYKLISSRKKAIKLVLMDQSIISGVGNIYANDALWEANIHPQTAANKLKPEETKELRIGLIKVLKEGIKYGGATAADAKYIDLDGLGGHYQDHFRVYDREGKNCLRRDDGVIKKVTLGGRGTYYCPKCQVG